jgi:hypothetical protein
MCLLLPLDYFEGRDLSGTEGSFLTNVFDVSRFASTHSANSVNEFHMCPGRNLIRNLLQRTWPDLG